MRIALPNRSTGRRAALFRRVPPKECPDDCKIADGIEPKWCSNSHPGDHQAAQGWTDGSADIDADAVRSDRGTEILLGDELWNDGLPDGSRQRGAHTYEKREQQEIAGRRSAEPDDGRKYRSNRGVKDFRHDQKFPSVNDVRECAGGQREQEQRQGCRHLDHRDDERIGVEVRHQPSGRRAVHPAADIGDDGRAPYDGKSWRDETGSRGSLRCSSKPQSSLRCYSNVLRQPARLEGPIASRQDSISYGAGSAATLCRGGPGP